MSPSVIAAAEARSRCPCRARRTRGSYAFLRMRPFVETEPASGAVEAAVNGNELYFPYPASLATGPSSLRTLSSRAESRADSRGAGTLQASAARLVNHESHKSPAPLKTNNAGQSYRRTPAATMLR
jgi:hypothetical protein